MIYTEQRNKLRSLLAGSECVSPASVHDPLSARIAEAVGYDIGVLWGSVVASTTLAAPDLLINTLTECADQIRRIMRVSRLSLIVDADYGYGNALNVMRTVQECEHAGASALCIEDTTGPVSFGKIDDREQLVSIEEGTGKMRAAVAARVDPSLVIVARTPALKVEGMESAVARARAYAAAGADAVFLNGEAKKLEHVHAVHAASKLPVIVGSGSGLLKREDLAACGARIMMQGPLPVAAMVKALQETYTHLIKGGAPADLKSRIASTKEMEQLVNGGRYQQWLREYMR